LIQPVNWLEAPKKKQPQPGQNPFKHQDAQKKKLTGKSGKEKGTDPDPLGLSKTDHSQAIGKRTDVDPNVFWQTEKGGGTHNGGGVTGSVVRKGGDWNLTTRVKKQEKRESGGRRAQCQNSR